MFKKTVALATAAFFMLPAQAAQTAYIDGPVKAVSLSIDEIKVRDQKELTCLARNVFFEARNQSNEGRLAIIMVTLNRIGTAPGMDTICKVVYRKCIFSWTCQEQKPVDPSRRKEPWEKLAWQEINDLVSTTVFAYDNNKTDFYDLTQGSTYYHREDVVPDWVKEEHLVRTVKIQQHIFYRTRTIENRNRT